MNFNDGSEHWNEENEIVHTCGLCEMVCMANEVQSHPCLESFASYYLDKQTYYFYPQCEDGKILRRSLVDGTEQNVLQALVREDAEETVQDAEMTDEEGFDIENLPENQNLRKIFIEERLIEAIRRRPPLWNFKLPITERGIRSKEKLWMDVVAVMKGVVTLADAKKSGKLYRIHSGGI
ncbi:PREDICTED: uncharacterized protein LOC105568995 [Vollenhovia emeryi]|uniref:uncharacterized protein LOC105568995 n=1 Tax=Vollenhovia emeryi TaxID=411798 RepID=UPI0005F36801|nr:PREDICTED: uncharacterized protein LOC105568995 [Vollenhovia emeryi]